MRTGITYILLWLSLNSERWPANWGRGVEDRESDKKPARQHCALGCNKGLGIDAQWGAASEGCSSLHLHGVICPPTPTMRASSVNQLIEKGRDCRLSEKLVFPNDTKGRNKSQFAE